MKRIWQFVWSPWALMVYALIAYIIDSKAAPFFAGAALVMLLLENIDDRIGRIEKRLRRLEGIDDKP